MVQEELSKEDKQRVNSCDFYRKAKEVMDAHERYKDLNVGEVYFIKHQNSYDKEWKYVKDGAYGNKPAKYMIFHKDKDDFVFIKRIIASGKLGKLVTCLTTEYSGSYFVLEPDPDQVESIILQAEGDYDPLQAEKEMVKKKGKARRRNKKLEIKHVETIDAFNHMATIKIGNNLWTADTSYGLNSVKWTVSGIERRDVNVKHAQSNWGRNTEDFDHHKQGFKEVIIVSLTCSSNKRNNYKDDTVTFYNLWKSGYRTYYSSKPFTADDF